MEQDIFKQMIEESDRILKSLSEPIETNDLKDSMEKVTNTEEPIDTLNDMQSYIKASMLQKLQEKKKQTSNTYNVNTRICLAYDTYDNWRKSDRILLRGEIAIVTYPYNKIELRIGDGETHVLDCPRLS